METPLSGTRGMSINRTLCNLPDWILSCSITCAANQRRFLLFFSFFLISSLSSRGDCTLKYSPRVFISRSDSRAFSEGRVSKPCWKNYRKRFQNKKKTISNAGDLALHSSQTLLPIEKMMSTMWAQYSPLPSANTSCTHWRAHEPRAVFLIAVSL